MLMDPDFDLSLKGVNKMNSQDILDLSNNLIKARSALIARSRISGFHWIDHFLYLIQSLKDVDITKKMGVSSLYYFALKAKAVPEFGNKFRNYIEEADAFKQKSRALVQIQ